MMFRSFAWALAIAGCRASDPASTAPNFQLVCDSSDVHDESTMFCIRLDTRNGDTQRLMWDRVPASQGSTKTEDRPPGRFQLACHATRNQASSDLYCLRLDTKTGEALLINLNRVSAFPEGDLPPPPPPRGSASPAP
jgi:hypothetical protein